MAERRSFNIVEIRSKLGLTQEDLARRLWPGRHDTRTLKLRTRTIQRWENGGVKPSVMARAHLNRILNDAEANGQEQKPVRKTAQLPTNDGGEDTVSAPSAPSGVLPGVRFG